jgi:hypothetical protein
MKSELGPIVVFFGGILCGVIVAEKYGAELLGFVIAGISAYAGIMMERSRRK